MSHSSPTSTSRSSSLPKIAHGRSRQSAKKLWKDHSSIDIYNNVQKGRLNTSDEPPLPVSKNPKPLYRRAVTNPKPFRILHSESNHGIRSTTSLPSLYAQMTFLANAVRNNDGSTSYRGMCEAGSQRRLRSQTVPSSAPGRLEAAAAHPANRDLHWQSASNERPMPRMLLPTSPRSNNNWYSLKSPRDLNSPPESPRKERSVSNIVRGPQSDSGIGSRRSFLHSIAQKRGQMVVAYEHNGKQHFTLMNPPEPSIPPQTSAKGRHSNTSGSSVMSSSYVSYTDSSSKSGTEFSIKGVGRRSGSRTESGRPTVRNPHAQDTEIISEVDGAQETTQENRYDDKVHPAGDGEEPEQVEESQEKDNCTSHDSDEDNMSNTTPIRQRKGKEVHFTDTPSEEPSYSESATPDITTLGSGTPGQSGTPVVNTDDEHSNDTLSPGSSTSTSTKYSIMLQRNI